MKSATESDTAARDGRSQKEARKKKLEELIVEQGVAESATFERLFGAGADLWANDAEFAAFMEHLRASRREKD